MTGGEFFAQAHICPVCHDDHGGPDCTDPDLCVPAQKAHVWQFDGDDPYVVCYHCGQQRDALTNRVIRWRP